MWHPIDISIASRPERDISIACAVRQLLRARDAGDESAMWVERHFLGLKVTSLADELLSQEPLWTAPAATGDRRRAAVGASKGRWLDGISRNKVAVGSPHLCLVSGCMTWGYADNVGGPQWAEPIECELEFSSEFAKLKGALLRFGDRRSLPDQRLPETLERIARDIESKSIQWAFFLHYEVNSQRS
jgi:hypothetical protein